MNKYFYVFLTLLALFSFLGGLLVGCTPRLNESKTWQKTYGGTGFDGAQCIQQTNDGGYIIAGRTDSFGAGLDDFYIMKIDEDGNIEDIDSIKKHMQEK